MSNLEILKVIKSKNIDPKGLGQIFSDRLFVKSTDSKWKDFSPFVASKSFIDEYERIKNFKVHEDDVWLCGFPRSGTTLSQELLWLIMNDYDFEGAKNSNTYTRAQWFENFNVTHKHQEVAYDYQDLMPRPRIFKTHLPVQFLPDQIWTVKPKMIYITRDVKDVAISHFDHRRNFFHETVETMEENFDDFLNDTIWFGPYREHVENYKRIPNYSEILYLTYEDLVTDMAATIKKIVEYLGKTITEEQLQELLEHLKFENMKKNKRTNMTVYFEMLNKIAQTDKPVDTFIRKGIIGDHKNQMSKEQIKRFDDWFAEGSQLKCGF